MFALNLRFFGNFFLLFSIFLSNTSSPQAQHHGHGAGQPLGRVHMEVSCNHKASESFNKGLLYQHSFGHAEAYGFFADAVAADASCSMAYWGMALSALDNLFDRPASADRARAAAALAQAPSAPSPWNAWLDALQPLTAPDPVNWQGSLEQFSARMEEIAMADPQNDEAQVFFALSLLMAAPAEDRLDTAHRHAAAILEPIWVRQPEHPGVMHYLIHAYDTADLAGQGIHVANRYAEVASASAHALHMPSHIYSRLGMWAPAISSNIRSAEVARSTNSVNDELHARDYLVYALLQSGRTHEAQRAWAAALQVGARMNAEHLAGPFAMAAMPARLALEPGDWAQAAALPLSALSFPQVAAITHFARGLGMVRSGQSAEAAREVAALSTLHDALLAQGSTGWAHQVGIQRDSIDALITAAAGDINGALAQLVRTAQTEDGLAKSVVQPGPLAPARELLGELLLSLGRNGEAEAAFEAVLRSNPNRFRSLAGAAAAAQAEGRPGVALARYRLLLRIAAKADAPRPELTAAHAALEALQRK
jgi:tetratricopeptide (TPR) repeat protein